VLLADVSIHHNHLYRAELDENDEDDEEEGNGNDDIVIEHVEEKGSASDHPDADPSMLFSTAPPPLLLFINSESCSVAYSVTLSSSAHRVIEPYSVFTRDSLYFPEHSFLTAVLKLLPLLPDVPILRSPYPSQTMNSSGTRMISTSMESVKPAVRSPRTKM